MNVFDEDFNDPAKLAQRIRVGGPLQSIQFAIAALRRLEAGGLKWYKFSPYTIHDYGCADGFGTVVLASEFPFGKVTGIDISTMYIERARELFPHLEWKVGDITDPQEEADIIWTSHTIEHLEDPIGAIDKLLKKTKKLLIIIVPPVGYGDTTHEGTLPSDVFLTKLSERFGNLLLYDDDYMTFRFNVDAVLPEHRLLRERNFMIVLRGQA